MFVNPLKEVFMNTRGKMVMAMLAVATLSLMAMILFTACDNRNAVDTTASNNRNVSDIAMYFDPPTVVVHKMNAIDTINIGILITDDKGRGMDSLTIELRRTPNVGVISTINATQIVGLYEAIYITSPGDTGTVIFTATAGNIAKSDSIYVLYQPVGVP
jgi:hypothetical protein